MDENDAPQNRSSDDAELSKSFDENSIIGKMKVGVSRILPSISNWLSPKVDVTNARRRRHEEIDSDDDAGAVRGNFPATTATDIRYQTTPQMSAPPPNKKKKTFSEFLNRNTFDLYSPISTPSISDRSNIVSSTLIEDVPHSRNVNQFSRYSTLENGQHATVTTNTAAIASNAYADEPTRENDRYNNDEASSSQSRDKPTNLFTINNDSSVVNFSAHLQRAKSLFTNRSYVSPRLKNYRMRNPRSSLYRSTSSLCDNNSVSSNASSAMSSPFYNGQTTFGGASASSRRMSTATTADIQMHHRPKVPTNLVTSRSTSSLNTIGGTSNSASMSTTAKRILDVMSKYNTPLTEVRRISNALPSIAETSAINKRKSILELEMTSITNDNDKSKRTLLKPNTPYNRPFGRNPVESVLTTELHVPSMPELLQLKKFAANTMKIRDLANKSDNILNRPVAEFTFSTKKPGSETDNRTTTDLDASNNNKFVNNKNNNAILTNSSTDVNKDHRNKIRNNLNKRNLGKRANDDDVMPEPVNLPHIPLVLDKKAEIKFSDPLKFPNAVDQKFSTGNNASDNGPTIPFKFKSSNTIVTPATKESKRTNGNNSENLKKFETSPTKSALSTSLSSSSSSITSPFNTRNSTDFTDKPQLPRNNSRETMSIYRFSEPIIVKTSASNSIKQYSSFGDSTTKYTFSEPIYVNDDKSSNSPKKDATIKTFGNFKFDPKQDKSVPNDSGIGGASSFGSNFSKSTIKSTLTSASSSSSFGGQLKQDDTFKSLVAKQKQGKWTCTDCFASNESTTDKCACCGLAKKGDSATVKSSQSQPAIASDDIFKSIVAKQKQSKWECNDCMTQNNQSESKCLCCGGVNPNASSTSVTDTKVVPPKPTFSFGTLPSSSTSNTSAASNQPLDSVFKSIVEKQKSTWECSACLNANDISKSKCACCEQSRDVTKGATTSTTVPAKSQFSFGSSSTFAPAKSGISFGSNADTVVSTASSSFSFGNLAAAKTTSPSAQFSFGNVKSSESSTESTKKSITSVNDEKTEIEKAKDSSVQKAPTTFAQFSFGSSTVLPSTNKSEITTNQAKPEASSKIVDSIFKSIVDAQKTSSWECASCMNKNSNNVEKCACCETPKDGSATKCDQGKKELNVESSQKFLFGSPSSTSSSGSTLGFGLKPENKSSSFQFGTSSSSTTTTASTLLLSATTTTAAAPIASSSTTNLFGSQSSTFSFSDNKSITTKESIATSQPAPASALSGFKFGFGSAAAPTFGTKDVSKDETDTSTSANANNKGITVLENVLVKPGASTNGPIESASAPKPFIFGSAFGGQSTSTTDNDPVTKAQKRSSSEITDNNVLTKFPATTTNLSGSPFVFGQSSTGNVTQTATPTTQKNPTFAFGTNKPSNTFPTVQPSFSFNATSATSSPFGGSTTAATASTSSVPVFGGNAFSSPSSAQAAPLNTAQTVFGSSVFSQPASTQSTTFGSSAIGSMGTSTLNAAAQPQATPAPATPGLFQFGASSNNNPSAALSSEPPKLGGFNFSLTTPPTFNFSEQSTQQANVPFQFGAPNADTPNMFSAQPANATAIQQRRKIRPIRRVNRPSTQF